MWSNDLDKNDEADRRTTRRKEQDEKEEAHLKFFFLSPARRFASPEGGIVSYTALQILFIDVPEI